MLLSSHFTSMMFHARNLGGKNPSAVASDRLASLRKGNATGEKEVVVDSEQDVLKFMRT